MVSVIIPTYNCAKYLDECLQSVFNQTYKEYEIIIIDDGSTDNTQEIIKNKYPKAKYIYQKHAGVSKARNAGIELAQGTLIAFNDADDIWFPNKLDMQVDYFETHSDVDMVFTENSFFCETGILMKTMDKKRLMKGDVVKNIFKYSSVATPTVMVKKEVFADVGLFDEDLTVAEDDNMWLRIALQKKVGLIDKVLVTCRISEGSLSRNGSDLFIGVEKHLQRINEKYPELRVRLGSQIRNKYYQLYFSWGLYYFNDNKNKLARCEFKKSCNYRRLKYAPFLYWFLTFLPNGCLKRLRKIKRTLGRR